MHRMQCIEYNALNTMHIIQCLECFSLRIVKFASTYKPDPACTDTQLTSIEKLSALMEDYENKIPRLKSKLMDIYFDVTDEKFNESSVTLVKVFKDDGTFEEGKGTDC